MLSTSMSFKAAAFAAAAWLMAVGHAETFLGSSRGATVEDLDRALTRELAAGGAAQHRIEEFEEALAATYAALPKNKAGLLDHQTVRYILHRLFVQRHGWYVKGLEPSGDTWSANSEDSAKDWVPSYLVSELEHRLKGGGVDLHDLGALAAAFEDLAQQEVGITMKSVYKMRGFSTDRELTDSQVQDIIDSYMVFFLGDRKFSLRLGMVEDFAEGNSYWNDTQAWFRGIERRQLANGDGSSSKTIGFKEVVKVAQDISAEYGSYNIAGCSKLKSELLGMWTKGNSTGRIRLADFYKLGLDSEWALTEKADYLQSIGALDDSNAEPLVIVPNYLTASPNCLKATQLYSVCCHNECEDLMGQLESQLATPVADPLRIASIVSTLGSETKAASYPREELSHRLNDIANLHGGQVHIHGRLFAQWMHHAFPSECPFPHEAGSSDPVTPDEWMGLDVQASEKERREQASQASAARSDLLVNGAVDIVLPWLSKEELLGAKHVDLTAAAKSLALELSGASKARVQEFRSAMQPYYAAWPKDGNGRIEPQTARYVLHRLFVQRHSWNIKGLEPNGDVWHKNSTQESLKDWVPAYLLNLLEERVGHHGLDLNDLAALAAAIEDLVNQEADGSLGEVFKALKLGNETSRERMHKAISAYMVVYLGSGMWNLPSALSDEFANKHSYWPATETWFSILEAKHVADAGSQEHVDFAVTAKVVKDIGASYGAYNDAECQKLKFSLLGMWSKGNSTGRVRLVDFYRLGLDSEFSLVEKASFLRSIGALDESNASSPMVIVPNYLSAMPNCLQATSLYAICCRNECEDLMSEVEKTIAAPTAAPREILRVVSSLGSTTVAAPRELPQGLAARLDDISALHGGRVNLHGRLFAQWLHHAFPSECPYPHEAGTSDPVTPDEWMSEEIEASEEERRQHLADDTCGPEQAAAEWNAELPWSHTEELLSSASAASISVQPDREAAPSSSRSALGAVLLIIVALGAALAAGAGPRNCKAPANYDLRLVLLSMIMLVAFVANLVNRLLVILIIGIGVASRGMALLGGAPSKALEKEKCLV